MTKLSLLRQQHPLAAGAEQVRVLNGLANVERFQDRTLGHLGHALQAAEPETLQINVGKLCNQTCSHCHVDAGPDRREIITPEVLEACLRWLKYSRIRTVDITGGAPEMVPQFRWLVAELRKLNCHVIDRCNLTILTVPGQEDLAEFLAAHQVEVIASLPCYLAVNVDRQRGNRVFENSIRALHELNRVGYGRPNSQLKLALVYNPVGPSLPPDPKALEDEYRVQLRERFGIEFSQLYTITNMPISRFLVDLLEQNRLEEYMSRLVQAFNPQTLGQLMCRQTLSVDWQGNLYDCDFNQMLDLPVRESAHLARSRAEAVVGLTDETPRAMLNLLTITSQQWDALASREIVVGQHCYGCTAGRGSSCQGSLV